LSEIRVLNGVLVESISGLHGPEHNIRDKGVNQSGGYSQTCEIIKPASSLLYTMGKYGKMMEHQLCKKVNGIPKRIPLVWQRLIFHQVTNVPPTGTPSLLL